MNIHDFYIHSDYQVRNNNDSNYIYITSISTHDNILEMNITGNIYRLKKCLSPWNVQIFHDRESPVSF